MNYLIKGGYVLNGKEDMKPEAGLLIIVSDGKIDKILKEEDFEYDNTYKDYKIIDLKGGYIMPGLINMHVHLPSSGKPKKKQTDPIKLVKIVTANRFTKMIAYKLCAGLAKTELLSGVTTIRTVGGIQDIDTKLRDNINAGKDLGPRILAGNMAVSVVGGHMADSLAYAAATPEDAAEYVRKIASEKPDLIKLMITGGVLDAKVKGEPGILKMQPEIIKAACDEAHKLGLIVAAHVESPEGVKAALANGVDTIEHGAQPDEEMIQLFKDRKSVHIATLSPALPFALFDRSISNVSEMAQYNGKVVFDGIIECAKECLANGIPVGLGTDTGCPYVTHYDMWRELVYFQKYVGVTSTFALYTATKKNAEIAGIDNLVGTVEEGKLAEFIVTKENPIEDLHALRHVSMVIKGDIFLNEPKVKKMDAVEKELDKFI